MSKTAASDEGLRIDSIGGECPMQAEGTVDGHPFYFRARGEHWSMSVGGPDVIGEPDWYYDEEYEPSAAVAGRCRSRMFAAGYIDEAEARVLIDRAVAKFREDLDAVIRHLLERLA